MLKEKLNSTIIYKTMPILW